MTSELSSSYQRRKSDSEKQDVDALLFLRSLRVSINRKQAPFQRLHVEVRLKSRLRCRSWHCISRKETH